MIVSTRVCLILLLPLLTHGTPTPPNPPSEYRSLLDGEIIPQFQVPGLPVVEETHGYDTVVLDKSLRETYCGLPIGTRYRKVQQSPSLEFFVLQYRVGLQVTVGDLPWIATTRKGDMVFLPPKTTIVLLKDSNPIHIPTGETGIRIIGQDDTLAQTTCVFPEGSVYLNPPRTNPSKKPDPLTTIFSTPANRIITTPEDKMVFVPAGSTIIVSLNHFRLPTGETEIRIIGQDDKYFRTMCIFPEDSGAQYSIPSKPLNFVKLTSAVIQSERIVVTRHGVFYLPTGTTVTVSSHYQAPRLPTGDTGIKEIAQEDLDKVTTWCKDIYKAEEKKVTARMRLEEPEDYEPRCYRINLWHIIDDKHELKKVLVKRHAVPLASQ